MRPGLITVVFAIVLVHTQFGAMTGAMDGVHTTPTPAVFLPLIIAPETTNATPTPIPTATPVLPPPIPTATPVLPPPSFTSCSNDPGSAINYPVRIVTVFKRAKPETVRLQNVSAFPVDLTGWRMCSIRADNSISALPARWRPARYAIFRIRVPVLSGMTMNATPVHCTMLTAA